MVYSHDHVSFLFFSFTIIRVDLQVGLYTGLCKKGDDKEIRQKTKNKREAQNMDLNDDDAEANRTQANFPTII